MAMSDHVFAIHCGSALSDIPAAWTSSGGEHWRDHLWRVETAPKLRDDLKRAMRYVCHFLGIDAEREEREKPAKPHSRSI
jgi:hypothetical protein